MSKAIAPAHAPLCPMGITYIHIGIHANKNYVIFVHVLTSKIEMRKIYIMALATLIHDSEVSATASESHSV